MSSQTPQTIYAQSSGSQGTQVFLTYFTNRAPTSNDIGDWKVGQRWVDTSVDPIEEYILQGFIASLGVVSANWQQLGSNDLDIQTLTGDSGGAVGPDASNNVNLLGTAGQITVTGDPGTNTLTLALAGGSTAVDSFEPDTGTNPVVPTAGGLVAIKGQNPANVSGIRVTGATNELDIAMFSPFVGDFAFTSSTSGDTETLTVSNSSNTASSQAQINAVVAGTSAGDAWSQWTLGSTISYALGIDTSSSDRSLQLTYSPSATVNPSTATNFMAFFPTTQSISVFTKTENVNADFAVEKSLVGDVLSIGITNTDTTDLASDAACTVTVPAPTSGDVYFGWGIGGGGQNYAMGIDNSDSDTMKLNLGNEVSSGTNLVSVTSTGCMTKPLQPAFLAYLAATVNDKTGNGTTYTLGTDALTEVYDQNGNFNTNGTFTAPVTGKYHLSAQVTLTGTTIATTFTISIITTARTYLYVFNRAASSADQAVSVNALADMAATNTATVTIIATGEAGDTDDIKGSATLETFFCGALIC